MLRIFYDMPFGNTMIINQKDIVHHIGVVLRGKCGDEVYLVNKNKVAKTHIIEISKIEIVLERDFEFDEDNELSTKITLGFGPLKGDNTQLVIQKAVELGATQINLINFKRNVSKFDSKKAEKKLEKFEKIIEGACSQSRRNIMPEIKANVSLTKDYCSNFDLIIVCYENERSNHITQYKQEITNAKNILVLIGPEGGITESELATLEKEQNVVVATLGKRILRAETASIASLSILSSIIEGEKI